MNSKQISGCFVCILIILIILYYNFRPKRVIIERLGSGHGGGFGHGSRGGFGHGFRGGHSKMGSSRGFSREWVGNSGYYNGGGGLYVVNPLYTDSYIEEEDYPFYYYPYYLYKRLYYV